MVSDLEEIKKSPAVLRLFTDRMKLRREGKELLGLCPFHNEKTPSFRVFQDQGTYLYKCFGCPEKSSGSVLDFVARFDKISLSAAIKKVKEYVESSWDSQGEKVSSAFQPVSQEESKVQKTYSEEEYRKLENALANCPEAQSYLLSERGISYETAKRLRLGYRQDVGRLAGTANADIANHGWISFPTFDVDHVQHKVHANSIKYRTICSGRKAFTKQPGMDTALFNLETVDFLEPVYLVEGEFDAAVLEQAGFRAVSLPNATTQVTPEWKDALLKADCVILAGDNDPAGIKLMNKLFKEMPRTYWLKWPGQCKDANQFFLENCKRDSGLFTKRIEELTTEARSNPVEGIYDIKQSLLTATHSGSDNPDRLRFPWPSIDNMAIITPGTVTTIYSSESGQGKTSFVLQATLDAAMKHGEIVLNYQAEMMMSQIHTYVASYLLRKDRLTLTEEDFKRASGMIGSDVKYYVGRSTSLTTIGEVIDLLEMAVKRFSATVVVLDNLGFLCRNETDQVKAQANAMQRLTNLAGSYSLKLILVHQARKADQNHKRKVAHVSDLDGSKAVQNDSSFVFNIHRDEIKHSRTDETENSNEYDPLTEIRLQKAREKGPGGSYAKLMFLGSICAFAELSHDQEPAMFG